MGNVEKQSELDVVKGSSVDGRKNVLVVKDNSNRRHHRRVRAKVVK